MPVGSSSPARAHTASANLALVLPRDSEGPRETIVAPSYVLASPTRGAQGGRPESARAFTGSVIEDERRFLKGACALPLALSMCAGDGSSPGARRYRSAVTTLTRLASPTAMDGEHRRSRPHAGEARPAHPTCAVAVKAPPSVSSYSPLRNAITGWPREPGAVFPKPQARNAAKGRGGCGGARTAVGLRRTVSVTSGPLS